ncbi:hypothetical protein Rsub_01169 [Raphidocelis subcapitata]|uniref:Transmembrane protein n=1 Tax=Raphidocelis subcapitata TaxID=307507 RepID=A0A2V0NLX6_9CHLO|nr:hypothetical protein Rsub_01169 [Raphidocelis subcapitata]|eukprot:GBF88456.1 hypothetical protein Rsub_01169 [Raphidocelis subcapitata]
MPLALSEAAAAALVGLIWGVTNPLIKRGSIAVERRRAEGGPARAGWLGEAAALLQTPSFLIPHAINQCASALFVLLLGAGARLGVVVPLANGLSLAANAAADAALGEAFRARLLLPGLALVAAGLALCSM